MVQCALFLLIAAFWFPSAEDLHDRIPQPPQRDGDTSSLTPHPYKFAICCCFVVHAIRNFSIASLEAGTAQLLEDKYGCTLTLVGILISITFLLTIPLKFVFDRLKNTSTRATCVR